jgi:hypothetical protein
MVIDPSDEQFIMAAKRRTESLEPGSKFKSERFRHPMKQRSEIVSNEQGMQIDRRDSHMPNAFSPRIESFEPGANVNSETLPHCSKQPA